MSEQDNARRKQLRQGGCISVLAAVIIGGFYAYRWVGNTIHSGMTHTTGVVAPYTMRLEDGEYTSMSPTGQKSWHVRAKRIDFARAPGSPLVNIDRIEITGLYDGTLYSERTGKPGATFKAGRGEYVMGQHAPVIADLAPNDQIEWEFRLSDDVKVRTAEGDTLQSPSIVILNLRDRLKGTMREMLLCEEGATVTHRDVSAHAVTARYDLQSRVVECMQGVTITMPKGTVLADRVFWMPDQHQIRIPENASGRMRDILFDASDVSIDTLTRKYRGAHAQLQFRESSGADVSLP